MTPVDDKRKTSLEMAAWRVIHRLYLEESLQKGSLEIEFLICHVRGLHDAAEMFLSPKVK